MTTSNPGDRQPLSDVQSPIRSPQSAIYHQLNYHYPVARLWSGGSYGNPDCFARTDRGSNLDGFWYAATNEWVCGRLDLAVTVGGQPLAPQETRFFPATSRPP
jgi:hypothetical protein